MILTILRLLSLFPSAFTLRSDLALGNLALRQQLAILKRQRRQPKLRRIDRFFWLLLSKSWQSWKETLLIVKPETVLRWHRQRFVSYWTRTSRKQPPGRPGIERELRELIRRMADSNLMWGAPRVHGDIVKAGIQYF
jgi:putative transposase